MTISVGGNDAGFTSVITTCAEPAWLSDCNGAVKKAQSYIKNTLPGSLSTLYSSIRAKAPPTRRSSWSATRACSTARTATP